MKFDLGYISKIASVSVILKEDGCSFGVVILKEKKGLLEIVKKEKHFSSAKELIKYIGNYTALILHFSGKGILNRRVDDIPNHRGSMLFDANFDDFYFTEMKIKNHIFSSMIRKNVVKDVIDLFNTKLNHIISISSGPFLVWTIQNQLNTKKIIVDDYFLEIENDSIVDFDKKDDHDVKNYTLDGKLINHKEISMVAHASQFFKLSDVVTLPEDEFIYVTSKEEARQKNIFIRFGTAMIFFVFVLLLANMIYLKSLNGVIANNYEKLSMSELTLAKIGSLNEEKNRKEKMLSSSGLLNNKFLSFYLMELSNSVPKEITFLKVSIRPYFDEVKKNFKIDIEENIIYVVGETYSSFILSDWIKKIERKEWIGKIDILYYVYEKSKGEFELKIEILNV